MNFNSHYVTANEQTLHVKVAGKKSSPVMLMLHGFPEYWIAWAAVAEKLSTNFRVILPDQRGFNLSSKPLNQDAYQTKQLVADMVALLDEVAPNQQVVLCGHDWGASVAYALAMRHADKVSHLVIANGVHPISFQKALLTDAAQMDASQYMNVLREEGSEDRLSANNYKPLLNMFEKFSAAPWLTDKVRETYRESWSQPNALSAMLNWYRGSPMIVPKSGTPLSPYPISEEMLERYRISMPHLLLWGRQDTALLPSSLKDLPAFCDTLTQYETADASHWILHEKPDWVAQKIRSFLINKK